MEYMNKIADGVTAMRDEFYLYRAQTSVQLLTSQLQFLQSLAAVTLALVAIVVGLGKFEISIFFTLSGSFALALILYVSAYTREIIDLEDKKLLKTEKLLEGESKAIRAKVAEAQSHNNENILIDYVNKKKETPVDMNERLNYAGEISMLLFHCSVIFCVIAIYFSYFPHIEYSNTYTVIGVVCLSFMLSFLNWSATATDALSKVFSIKFTKKNED